MNNYAQTDWKAVTFGILTIIILIAYGQHIANPKGSGSNDSGFISPVRAETLDTNGSVVEPNCTKVGNGEWDCSNPEVVKKWNQYLESQIKELEAKKAKKATVTMYTSRAQETDDSPCIAANGKDICKLLAQGVQTCASNDYKLGTKLNISTLGECIVMDRMNSRYTGTGRIDWYAGFDLKSARAHGVKTLAVTIQ